MIAMRNAARAVLAAFVCLAASGSETSRAQQRPFPETVDRIRVFADQFPGGATAAQIQFIATHYAGSQKMPVRWTERIRALNPGFLMLHYQLAVGAGPAAFLVGNTWTNDFASVSRHESWFMRSPSGERLKQPAWNWYLMDVRFHAGKPRTGFPAYWVSSALSRMRANQADGCFADSYTQDILVNQLQPATVLFSSPVLVSRDWLPGLNEFGDYCSRAFHAAPEHFRFLPNLGGLVTTWDHTTNLLVGDGGMIEGFCSPNGPDQPLSLEDWQLQMSRILLLASNGKIVLCQSYIPTDNLNNRWFVMGAYLLTRGPQSYLNMFAKSSLEWYPEYGLDLGAYAAPPAASLAAYWRADWGVYRRDYAKGVVLVNPSERAVSIPRLDGGYLLVSSQGGGAVRPDGQTSGSITTMPVSSVTIPAHSARVLLRRHG